MSPETSPVPPAVRAASEWAWRLLLLAAGVLALIYLLGFLSEVVIPIVVAVLLTALLSSVHRRLARTMPRGAAAGVTVLGTIVVIAGLLTLVGTQISGGFGDMVTQAGTGVTQIRDWLRTTFKVTDTQFDTYVDQLQKALTSNADVRKSAARAGVTATHGAAGLFISLFTLFSSSTTDHGSGRGSSGSSPPRHAPGSTPPALWRGTSFRPTSAPPSSWPWSTPSASPSAR